MTTERHFCYFVQSIEKKKKKNLFCIHLSNFLKNVGKRIQKIKTQKIPFWLKIFRKSMDLSYWCSLPRRKRRIAEEAALLNWYNPELVKFARHWRDCVQRKRSIRQEYGDPHARMSLETGIILTKEQLEQLSEDDHLLYEFLFDHPLYQRYVLQCAQRICDTDPAEEALALSALKIFHQVMKLKNSMQRCPRLLYHVGHSFFSISEKISLRLVSKHFAEFLRPHMVMRIRVEDQMIYLPLSSTTDDLRRIFNNQANFCRYGKLGPILPEGLICQVHRADIFLI
jgi:hypothetical protein